MLLLIVFDWSCVYIGVVKPGAGIHYYYGSGRGCVGCCFYMLSHSTCACVTRVIQQVPSPVSSLGKVEALTYIRWTENVEAKLKTVLQTMGVEARKEL